MSEKNDSALIKRPSGAIEKSSPGTKRILADMVSDALALVPSHPLELHQARYRIGDFEWCEPDYLQIMLWAKALNMQATDFLNILSDEDNRYKLCSNSNDPGIMNMDPLNTIPFLVDIDALDEIRIVARRSSPLWVEPYFSEGRLLRIIWNITFLPITKCEWIEDLQITHLEFLTPILPSRYGRPFVDLGRLHLRKLVYLECSFFQLHHLDLTAVPELLYLGCHGCSLSKLDLNAVSKLKTLDCGENNLSQLHIAHMSDLENLSCRENEITKLELPQNSALKYIDCRANQIGILNLTEVPALEDLNCSENRLSELSLFSLPELKLLSCRKNAITRLDTSAVPNLEHLNCAGNKISELNLSSCINLKWLDCSGNRLHSLDLSRCVNLEYLNCAGNKISELNLSSCVNLEHLDCINNRLHYLDIRPLSKNLIIVGCDCENALSRRSDQVVVPIFVRISYP